MLTNKNHTVTTSGDTPGKDLKLDPEHSPDPNQTEIAEDNDVASDGTAESRVE